MDRQPWVQDLLDKIDITDLFQGDGYQIDGAGFTTCRFHSDKKPSLKVYDDGWFCFGCERGGSAIDYIIERDGCEFWEAFKTLAAMYNHPLPSTSNDEHKAFMTTKAEAKEMRAVLKEAFKIYNVAMTEDQRSHLRNRGFTDETIDFECLGYASGASLGALVKKYSPDILAKTGLFFQDKSGGLTETYKRRFLFPYWHNGEIVYSIGRLDTNDPKIIETLPDWNKGKYRKHLTHNQKFPYVSETIQNIIWNGDKVKEHDIGVIAEGITDGLLFKQDMTPLHQMGVISPVTKRFKIDDIETLVKLVTRWKTVYLIPDNEENEEGLKGAQETAHQLFIAGITNVRIVTLPRAEDTQPKVDLADVLNQPNKDDACEKLKGYIDDAPDYLTNRIEKARDLPDVDKDGETKEIARLLTVLKETSFVYQKYVNMLAEGKTPLVSKKLLPKLLHEIKQEEKTEGDEEKIMEEEQIGDGFLAAHHTVDAKVGLVYHQQDWFVYAGTHYKYRSTPNMRAEVARFVKYDTTLKVTAPLVNNVMEELGGVCLIMDDIELPAWITDPMAASHAGYYLSFKNGILNFGELLNDEEVELESHTPDLFITYSLPYDFDPEAKCPKWEAILHENLEGDADTIRILQEFMGYCLIHETGFHKALIIFGPSRTGKSTYTKVFSAVLGEENCSHVPLESFGQRFALASTLGKLANIASEIGELDTVAEGAFKSFVAGDAMTFDRKYKDSLHTEPTARLVLATNTLPRFWDKTDGIWNRLLLVPFNHRIPPEERVVNIDKEVINEELSGVFMWAFEGLYRLRQQQQFSESVKVEAALEEYKLSSNPTRMFLEERYDYGEGNLSCNELYRDYAEWCEEFGFKKMNANNLGREIKRTFPNSERTRKNNDGSRVYYYTNIVVKTE